MSVYLELLRLAEEQLAAVRRGDLEAAIDLLEPRGALLNNAGEPTTADEDAIREVLRLDGELSGAIGERMIELRAEALAGQRGRQALSGYNPPSAQPSPTIDRAT